MDGTQAFRFLVALADQLLLTARATLQAGEEAQTTDLLREITTVLEASHVVDVYRIEVNQALRKLNLVETPTPDPSA